MAFGLARHAGQRQALVAQNIANADTPGYAAKDVRPFTDIWQGDPESALMTRTRPTHFSSANRLNTLRVADALDLSSEPNGNSVSLESEILKSAEIRRDHDRALAIYRSSLNILRTALGRT